MSKMLSNISIRVWHPRLSAERVTNGLGIEPEYVRSIGEPRAAPNGRLLGGINEQTYVWARLVHKENVELGDMLESCYERLHERRAFIRELVTTGGEAEFYVSIFLRNMGGFCIKLPLVRKFADLGVGLSVELYQEEDSPAGTAISAASIPRRRPSDE